MSYISIKQAAEKWNVTVRRVQELCKKGAILGAKQEGHAWKIPEDAKKPADGRKKKDAEETDAAKVSAFASLYANTNAQNIGGFMVPVPRQNPYLIHTDLYNTVGTADEVVASFAAFPETEKIARAQFDYQRGNLEKFYKESAHFLENHIGFYSTICAGSMLAKCAIFYGDVALWRKARQHIYEAPCQNDSDRVIVDFWLAINDSAIHDTRDIPDWFRKGMFDCLPADTFSSARLYYVKILFIAANELASGKIDLPNVKGMGLMKTIPYILEPMISQAKIERTIIPEIYLHLMAATVYHNLGDDPKATEHLDTAIALCLPDSLYMPLAEYRMGLDNLLDDRLILIADEQVFKKVKELHKQMHAGFLKLHNKLLERNISSTLTMRERQVAKLAAFGMTNTEISERLHIELSSVKSYIFSAMNKCGAEKRTELGQYI